MLPPDGDLTIGASLPAAPPRSLERANSCPRSTRADSASGGQVNCARDRPADDGTEAAVGFSEDRSIPVRGESSERDDAQHADVAMSAPGRTSVPAAATR